MHMSIIMKVEVSFNSGVSCCLLDGKRGMINAQQVLVQSMILSFTTVR
jgi:hypothetical protein